MAFLDSFALSGLHSLRSWRRLDTIDVGSETQNEFAIRRVESVPGAFQHHQVLSEQGSQFGNGMSAASQFRFVVPV